MIVPGHHNRREKNGEKHKIKNPHIEEQYGKILSIVIDVSLNF